MKKLIVVLACAAALLVAAAGAPVESAKQAAISAGLKSLGLGLDIYVECYNVIYVGDVWESPGAEMFDLEDGDISDQLQVDYPDGPVDTSVPGAFREIWSGKDAAGNDAIPKLRVVIVEEVPDTDPPVISLIGCAE